MANREEGRIELMTLRRDYEKRYDGPLQAAVALTRDLMRGDPANFKAGYTIANATLAAADLFPEVPIEDIIEGLNS